MNTKKGYGSQTKAAPAMPPHTVMGMNAKAMRKGMAALPVTQHQMRDAHKRAGKK